MGLFGSRGREDSRATPQNRRCLSIVEGRKLLVSQWVKNRHVNNRLIVGRDSPYGRVVANQKNIVPIEAGTIASIILGRPASPISIPTDGSQKPAIAINWFTDRVGPFKPFTETTASMTHQRAPLRTGIESPTKLARDRQSEKGGVLKYPTTPHSQMKGQQMPRIGAIDQKSTIPW